MNPTHGRCLCGDITFTADLPSLWVAHCHCTMCQRNGGSAFITWVGLDEKSCHVDDPKQQLRWYQSSDLGARGFCSHCGSTLFFRSSRWPGELHVTLANFDAPVDRAPQAHAFWDTHVDWVALDPNDGLPRKTAAEIS
jgi:hypothetical protein